MQQFGATSDSLSNTHWRTILIQGIALPFFIRCLPLLLVLGLPLSSVADEPENTVIIALDLSSSYFNEDRFKQIRRNFQKLATIVQSPALKHPTIFQVIQIGDMSQGQGLVCEYELQPKSLVSRRDRCRGAKDCSVNPRDAGIYFKSICSKTVIDHEPAEATDIEGALSLAGQLADSQQAYNNYLFIMSDMFEYQGSTDQITTPNLKDFKVIVVCASEARDSSYCMSQEKSWSARLEKLGVVSTNFVVETSRWEGVAEDMFE